MALTSVSGKFGYNEAQLLKIVTMWLFTVNTDKRISEGDKDRVSCVRSGPLPIEDCGRFSVLVVKYDVFDCTIAASESSANACNLWLRKVHGCVLFSSGRLVAFRIELR